MVVHLVNVLTGDAAHWYNVHHADLLQQHGHHWRAWRRVLIAKFTDPQRQARCELEFLELVPRDCTNLVKFLNTKHMRRYRAFGSESQTHCLDAQLIRLTMKHLHPTARILIETHMKKLGEETWLNYRTAAEAFFSNPRNTADYNPCVAPHHPSTRRLSRGDKNPDRRASPVREPLKENPKGGDIANMPFVGVVDANSKMPNAHTMTCFACGKEGHKKPECKDAVNGNLHCDTCGKKTDHVTLYHSHKF
jgi:hypothetical protein